MGQIKYREITLDKYFELERNVSFNLSALLGDINGIQKRVLNSGIDISPFISKASHAFLPKLVYELEEYGLPRMISRKIHNSGLLDLERQDISVNDVIAEFNSIC